MGPQEGAFRVLRLDDSVFDEVARDELATGSAVVVLLGAAALDALGGGGGLACHLQALATIAARAALWIVFIHAAARILGGSYPLAPLFRATAFAQAPLALGLVDSLPLLGSVAWIAKWALVFTTTALATGRALGTGGAAPPLLCAVALGAALLVVQVLP